ncbi:VanZ family protein [Streptomyces sp. P9-2B-2]|uniref:VanZ family protein n=1 Tax=Streptomyces sp. P9-2B-2 TaxID=3057114 RepID=UPI0025B51605|nr:VanZ family protein [Streptomyces sp. P9-2B-2]WJY35824.1 VanZ family protein [Streptomyces sp. P9-2B-2]
MWQVVLYISPVTVTLFIAAMAGLSGAGAWWYQRENGGRALRAARVLLVAWTTLVLLATLMPTQPLGTGGHDISWIPGEGMWEASGSNGGLFPEEQDMIFRLQIANAAMFVPLASLLAFAIRCRSVLVVTGVCLLTSVLIEMVQFIMAAGRTVDVDDVLFNSLGAALGALAATVSLRLAERPGPTAARHASRNFTRPGSPAAPASDEY